MKDMEEARARLKGVFNITMTPFAKDGALDLDGLARNVERVIDLGYDGVLIGGTYGEFPTMTVAERADVFRRVMDVIGDRAPAMLCSAGSDPRDVFELTRLAGDLGGVPMVTPPYVSEITDDQIVEFFREVAPLSKTGIIIYNAPGIGITLSPGVINRIAEIPGMVGLKQGDLNPTAIDRIANDLRGKVATFCASDLAFLGPVMAGFDGFSTTNSGALPELVLATWKAVRSGDAQTATALHALWYDYRQLARAFGQPQTVKAAMNLRGFDGGSVRLPLRDVPPEALEKLRAVMERLAADPRSGVTLA
ncbi:dihydrodipicolinate synthase family protein [Pseudogemmobacter sonorensis]|uniref:dihydrodipicolinate synthase family protein n=1 Tax=Pseudogemmobacter sonorensis TaxID=2989681 RepID=UPI0036B11EC3